MGVGIDPRFQEEFDRLLAAGDLLDFDRLMVYDGYFDELPLFATYPEIAFLDGLPPQERDRVLVRAAVAHLGRVLDHAADFFGDGEPDFFCAVTVTGWDYREEGAPLVPRFWRANPSRGVFDHLRLDPPVSQGSALVADFLDHDPAYPLNDDIVERFGDRRLERVFVQRADHPVPERNVAAREAGRD